MVEPAWPNVPPPQGQYVPAVVHGGIAVSAGMTPRVDGRLTVVGTVGTDVSVPDAFAAAGLAAANALGAIAQAVGGLPNVARCLRMTVYIACRADFTEHSAVADGASAELRRRLGDRGAVARSAIGVASLPSGAPVEVELMVAAAAG
ncbi:MAG: RidA family protein [Jatrophihabitantaceae bacterium]